MNVTDVKIDKLTVVANVQDDSFLMVLKNSGMLQVFEGYTDYVKGLLFPKSLYAESAYLEYDRLNSVAMKKRELRIEFNPDKLTQSQMDFIKSEILRWCNDIAFSRADLALDCNENLGSYTFEPVYAKSMAKWWGKDGKVETIYLGKGSSAIQIRVYDKRVERLAVLRRELASNERNKETSSKYSLEVQNGLEREIELLEAMDNWWRLEFELKGSDRLDFFVNTGFCCLFDDFRIMDYDLSEMSGIEKVMLVGLLERPELFDELNKNTKSKYKKMFRELGGVDLSKDFREELQKKEPLILADLRDWLK